MTDVSWFIFLAASLAVIVTPGQDMVLVLSRGMGQGALAGIVTAAGVSSGLLLHTVLATLGLGALLQTSELLFTMLKIAGAVYLVWIGIRLLREGAGRLDVAASRRLPLRRAFRQGMLSNLTNPKIALFYLAFLPQFMSASAAAPKEAIFTMGLAFAVLTFLIKGPVGFFAGTLSGWLRANPRALGWIHRIGGGALLALGVRLAFEQRG
jgi:threonine/homoserine/homoserine lactone efflux protein